MITIIYKLSANVSTNVSKQGYKLNYQRKSQ